MDKQKYILSPNCKLLDFTKIHYRKWPATAKSDPEWSKKYFILQRDNNWYLIPLAVKSFLENFVQANSLKAAISELAQIAGCEKEEISSTVEAFLSTMLRRRIIRVNKTNTVEKNQDSQFANSLRKGKLLNNYRIESKIFSNSKTEIYKALRLSDGETVALKILRLKRDVSAEGLKKYQKSFFQEFQLMKEIGTHPHICAFIEQGQLVRRELSKYRVSGGYFAANRGAKKEHSRSYMTDEQQRVAAKEAAKPDRYLVPDALGTFHYGVMEFIEGKSLRAYLKKNEVNVAARLSLLSQFFSAMAYLHRKGIIHGDIHLSNILVNEKGLLKLIDFNMSNRAVLEKDEIIREGGVYPYIPPEKINDHVFSIVNAPADFRSELYQMGVVAYYVLYGHMPFEGFFWKELAAAIRLQTASFTDNAATGERLEAYVLKILERLLHKDPQKRYTTAHHFYKRWKYHQQIAKKTRQTTPVL